MSTADLDLSRFDKGELRCLVELLLANRIPCSPELVARAKWKAAAARASRLSDLVCEALRDYTVAYENEIKALRAGQSATRLTKTRMDAEAVWRRAQRSSAEAHATADRRWDELQLVWTTAREAVQ